MENKFDLKQFYEKEKINEMKLDENLTMFDIYEELKLKNNLKEETFVLSVKNKDIKITVFNNETFELIYKNIELSELFIIPFNMIIERKNLKIEVIGAMHLNHLLRKYEIKNRIIECGRCKEIIKWWNDLFRHNEHPINIKDQFIFNYILKSDFDNFFKYETNFEKSFDSPDSFEKNFKYYFKHYYIYKDKEFKLFNDKKRDIFIRRMLLTQQFIQRNTLIFGQTGMGKSITILRVFKYLINHKNYGTLYINCKCLTQLLEKNEYETFKSVVIDEIPYLFCGDYESYYECLNIINKYELKNGNNNLWILIKTIIEFVIKIENFAIKNYIFIFDQYNNTTDKEHYLSAICKKFLHNDYSIGIISLCSMNNSDIKEYKIQKIELELSPLKNNNYTDIYEVNDLFDINTLIFKDEETDHYFDLLGRNIKTYNILKEKENHEDELSKYLKGEKDKIYKNIEDYYECDKDDMNITKLLYFSTTSKYNLDNFREKAKYIPFKYFIPEISVNEKKDKYISIKYAFPLVEEVVNELINSIIYKDINFYKTLVDKKDIDGGARGILFEKLVTYYLKPNKNENNYKFFNDITIEDEVIVKKFVPKSNEKKKKCKEIKKHLDDGVYLFTQTMTTGKAFDLLIVTIKKNYAKIIAIQVTIHKPDDKIYNYNFLQNCYKDLKEYLGNFFDFKYFENDFSFLYIFDLSYKDSNTKEFNSMINKCDANHMKYIFFNFNDIKFVNINNENICELNLNITHAFIRKRKVNDIKKEITIKEKISKFNFVYFVNFTNEKEIIKILKEDTEFGEKINKITYEKIEYLNKLDFGNYNNFEKNKIYVIKYEFYNVVELIYFSMKEKKFIERTIGKLEVPYRLELYSFCEIYLIEHN